MLAPEPQGTSSSDAKPFRRAALVDELARQQLWLDGCNILLVISSLIFMMTAVELSLQGGRDTAVQVLLGFNLALTAGAMFSVSVYHRVQMRLLRQMYHARRGRWWDSPMCEWLVLLVGVIPPGVEREVELPLIEGAIFDGLGDHDDPMADMSTAVVRSVTVVALLQFVRLILLFGYLLRATMSLGNVRSPAVLSWQYGRVVEPSFRVKYLFTRYPFAVLLTSTLSSLISGAFCTHALEPALKASYWRAIFEGIVLMTDAPVTEVETVPGSIVAIVMIVVGVTNVAFLTATLAQKSELTCNEANLIREIEEDAVVRHRQKLALCRLQTFLRARARGRSGRRASAVTKACRRRSGSDDQGAGARVAGGKSFTQVSNMAVLHQELEGLSSQQLELSRSVAEIRAMQAAMMRAVGASSDASRAAELETGAKEEQPPPAERNANGRAHRGVPEVAPVGHAVEFCPP